MIKYGTKIYRCIHCGIQTTENPREFVKQASAFSCIQGVNKHQMEIITKEDENGVQEVSKIQSG